MPDPIKLNPTQPTLSSKSPTKIEKIVDWRGRKLCAIRCLLQPALIATDIFLATIKFGELFMLTLIASGTGGVAFRTSKEFTDDYLKSLKNFLIKLARLAIRIIQSVPNFFGHLAGFLIHPSIGIWTEQKTSQLEKYKFLQLPSQLQKLFQATKGKIPNYFYTHPIAKASVGSTPTEAEAPPPTLEENGQFYVPDFTKRNDYARIFGLTKSHYTPEEIKDRFKKLSLKYHPDRNPEPQANDNFERIIAAKDYLLNNPHFKAPSSTKPAPAISKNTPPPSIILPHEALSEDLFIQTAQTCLSRIVQSKEIYNVDSNQVLEKCKELISLIQSYQKNTPPKEKTSQEQLLKLEALASTYLSLSTTTITPEMLKQGQTNDAAFKMAIAQAYEKGKEIFSYLSTPSPRQPTSKASQENQEMQFIRLGIGFLYFDRMNGLYLTLIHSLNNQKKKFESVCALREYRATVALQFYTFFKTQKSPIFEKLISKPASKTPLLNIANNACKNYRMMISIGNEVMFYLVSEFLV